MFNKINTGFDLVINFALKWLTTFCWWTEVRFGEKYNNVWWAKKSFYALAIIPDIVNQIIDKNTIKNGLSIIIVTLFLMGTSNIATYLGIYDNARKNPNSNLLDLKFYLGLQIISLILIAWMFTLHKAFAATMVFVLYLLFLSTEAMPPGERDKRRAKIKAAKDAKLGSKIPDDAEPSPG